MAIPLAMAAVAFLIAVAWSGPYIRFLRTLGIGKKIRIDGPTSHMLKTGTPTMGGLIITVTVTVMTVGFNLVEHYSILLPLGTIAFCGVLGAVDDLINLVGSKRNGLTARFKFAWLVAIGIAAAYVLEFRLGLSSVYVPFVGKFSIGLFYLPIAAFAVVAMSNAVNITDGLDSLAGVTVAVAFAAYGVIAHLQDQTYLATFCFTVVGASLAFLWFNAHPADVFMGDTGALALGATLAVVAFMTGHWLLLPVIGIVFVAEALSDIIQVAYFKLTGGKRVFKMAPLHHHFELVGWSEVQVSQRFWLVGMLAGMLGVALALS